jgi:hypothetical protein
MAPAHLRCAEATGGLVDGATPSIEPPRGANGPRGYAPLGIGLGRFLTCGRIQLVRRSVAAPMCSAGYAKIGLGRFSSRYRRTPESTGLRGKHVIGTGNRLWFAKARKPALERGGVPRSGRITGTGGAQRPQAGLLRLRQGLGTSGGEKAASGRLIGSAGNRGALTRRRPGRGRSMGRTWRAAGTVELGLAGGWPAWRPAKGTSFGTDAPAR